MADAEKQKRLEGLILDYLTRNPEAGDTLEGITRYWLELERIDASVNQVAEACNDLLKRGFVNKQVTQDGRVVYKLDKKL